MSIDSTFLMTGLIAVGALIVVLIVASGLRRKRTSSLREKFGREYDHVVREMGSRARAERNLLARSAEVKGFDIRTLAPAEQTQFRTDWARIEQRFVDRPTTAVAEADELIALLMHTRGYPMGDFEKHASHLSVTHPRIVERYRAGHRIIVGTPGSASTEDLRQAMLHYRALFDELTGGAHEGATDIVSDVPRVDEVTAPRAASTDLRRDEDRRPSDTSR